MRPLVRGSPNSYGDSSRAESPGGLTSVLADPIAAGQMCWVHACSMRAVESSVRRKRTNSQPPTIPFSFTSTRRLAAYTQPEGAPGDAGDSLQVNLAAAGMIAAPAGMSDDIVLDLMRSLGITYVYSGAQEGRSKSRLNVEAMRADPGHYELVYFENGVYIFRALY